MGTLQTEEAVVIGAGAAGCFAAIRMAEAGLKVRVLERGRIPLRKVRISGGGRCNVTHACFDPAALILNYPRGHRELRGAFHRFQPRDTVEWFKDRGVVLKTEADGRMFPVTDSSSTIVDCLLSSMERLGVEIIYGVGIGAVRRLPDGSLELLSDQGRRFSARACLLSAGSLSDSPLAESLGQLGHTLVSPVPSLFTFKLPQGLWADLAGVSIPEVTLTLPGMKFNQSGPMLVTHAGLSGPAVLKLSAWAARELHALDYRFRVRIQWLSGSEPELRQMLESFRREHPKKRLDTIGPPSLPRRLWQRLVRLAGADSFTWSQLPAARRDDLLEILSGQEVSVEGKSTHKEEFVTCGGVALKEVDFRTMESRICPGLYFAGETLDIDGVTGGFNFQAAWTTGYIAGSAIAAQ